MGIKRCYYGDCKSDIRYSTADHMKGVKFYTFPTPQRQPLKFEKWIECCGLKDVNPSYLKKFNCSTKNSLHVCSKHFEGNAPTKLKPDPIKLDGKVVIINDRRKVIRNANDVSEQSINDSKADTSTHITNCNVSKIQPSHTGIQHETTVIASEEARQSYGETLSISTTQALQHNRHSLVAQCDSELSSIGIVEIAQHESEYQSIEDKKMLISQDEINSTTDTIVTQQQRATKEHTHFYENLHEPSKTSFLECTSIKCESTIDDCDQASESSTIRIKYESELVTPPSLIPVTETPRVIHISYCVYFINEYNFGVNLVCF